jgi:chloramphenicol 3-O-phosphotransferase
MIILLNGPLGIGKSTLSETLTELIDWCAMLDGDHLIELNPPPANEQEALCAVSTLLIAHYQSVGYRNFVLNHLWTRHADLSQFCAKLSELDPHVHCFRLTLPVEDNLRRIERRASATGLDRSYELDVFSEEHRVFSGCCGDELGIPLDASNSPVEVANQVLALLGLE